MVAQLLYVQMGLEKNVMIQRANFNFDKSR